MPFNNNEKHPEAELHFDLQEKKNQVNNLKSNAGYRKLYIPGTCTAVFWHNRAAQTGNWRQSPTTDFCLTQCTWIFSVLSSLIKERGNTHTHIYTASFSGTFVSAAHVHSVAAAAARRLPDGYHAANMSTILQQVTGLLHRKSNQANPPQSSQLAAYGANHRWHTLHMPHTLTMKPLIETEMDTCTLTSSPPVNLAQCWTQSGLSHVWRQTNKPTKKLGFVSTRRSQSYIKGPEIVQPHCDKHPPEGGAVQREHK